jgi:hypothetical protein
MYSTMCSSVGSEQRGGHRNPPLSRQATSAELIASIRFSTRPEDILYLHLKDGRAPHMMMITTYLPTHPPTHPPTSATTHNAHSTHHSPPTRCSASTQSCPRARHLDGNHTAAPPVFGLSPMFIHAETNTLLSRCMPSSLPPTLCCQSESSLLLFTPGPVLGSCSRRMRET